MNYWSGVDKNTDNCKSIFNQDPSLFLLMRMSLLLHFVNLSWVSSHFQQITIGNTYFIISSLNYRWNWEVFMSLYALFVTSFVLQEWKHVNLFEPLYQKSGRIAEVPLQETSLSIHYQSYAEIKMLWILETFVLRKRLLNQIAAVI